MSSKTIVTACDHKFVWGTFLLLLSLRRNGVRIPVHVMAHDLDALDRELLTQFDDVKLFEPPAEENHRNIVYRKTAAILTADTDLIMWIDSDCLVTGDITPLIDETREGLQIRMRPDHEIRYLFKKRYLRKERRHSLPRRVLETWRDDVGQRQAAALNTSCNAHCFVVHRCHLDFIRRWDEQIRKVIPDDASSGVVDDRSFAYFLLDEAVMSSMLAFADGPPPICRYRLEEDPARSVVHFGGTPKPWDRWLLRNMSWFDEVQRLLDWADTQGIKTPERPWNFKRSNRAFCWSKALFLEMPRRIRRTAAGFKKRKYPEKTVPVETPPDAGAKEQGTFFAREAVSGIPWMVASKGILFFVYFAISVLIVRLLGSTQFGVYALCMNIAEYAGVLCGLGLVAALFRFVPELVVQRNAAGLKRHIWKTLAAQGGTTLMAIAVFALMKPLFDRWFDIDFRYYLVLSGVLIGFTLLKENVAAVETSLFRAKNISLLTLARGLIWLGLVLTLLRGMPTVASALWTQIISYGAVYIIGAWIMFRHIYRLDWRSPPYSIGRRRTFKYSAAILGNSVVRMMMMKYTEVFFLGLMVTPAVIGAYDLGYSLPPLVIFFIPDSLHMLFTSGFAEAYSRDPTCLGRLIKAYYKMQVLFTVPLALFGFFFAPAAVTLVYGPEMSLAGVIASIFCLIHLLSTISTPLSMALKAKEQVLATMPIMMVQIVINLILDWLLIVHFNLGVWGGMAAVAGTFIISAPIRLTVVRRILGGIYFPLHYLMRLFPTLFLLAAGLSWLSRRWNLLGLFELPALNIAVLFLIGLVYMGLFVLSCRFLHLVREEDVADFRALDIKKLNFVFDLIAPRK